MFGRPMRQAMNNNNIGIGINNGGQQVAMAQAIQAAMDQAARINLANVANNNNVNNGVGGGGGNNGNDQANTGGGADNNSNNNAANNNAANGNAPVNGNAANNNNAANINGVFVEMNIAGVNGGFHIGGGGIGGGGGVNIALPGGIRVMGGRLVQHQLHDGGDIGGGLVVAMEGGGVLPGGGVLNNSPMLRSLLWSLAGLAG